MVQNKPLIDEQFAKELSENLQARVKKPDFKQLLPSSRIILTAGGTDAEKQKNTLKKQLEQDLDRMHHGQYEKYVANTPSNLEQLVKAAEPMQDGMYGGIPDYVCVGRWLYSSLDKLTAAKEIQETRMTRTVEVLKKRGFCKEKTWDEISERAEKETNGLARWWHVYLESVLDRLADDDLYKTIMEDIEEHCNLLFAKGVELTVLDVDPGAFGKEDLYAYAHICRGNERLVYLNTMVFTVSNAISVLAYVTSKAGEMLAENLREARRELNEAREEMNRLKKTHSDEKVEVLRAWLSKANADKLKLQQEKMSLQRKLAAMERKLDKLEHPEKYQNDGAPEPEEEEENNEPVVIAPEEGKKDYPLPESGVVYLGGHINLINKLEKEFPTWRFIKTDEKCRKNWIGSSANAGKISLLIINAGHISHSLFEKTIDSIPADVPVIYIDSVNIKIIKQKLQEEWNSVCANLMLNN